MQYFFGRFLSLLYLAITTAMSLSLRRTVCFSLLEFSCIHRHVAHAATGGYFFFGFSRIHRLVARAATGGYFAARQSNQNAYGGNSPVTPFCTISLKGLAAFTVTRV